MPGGILQITKLECRLNVWIRRSCEVKYRRHRGGMLTIDPELLYFLSWTTLQL